MKNKIYKLALVLSAFVLAIACNEDDFTGDSTLTPSNPSLSVDLDFTNGTTLVESETDYEFTVMLSEPQIVDVVVNVAQTGGTATEGDDFSIPHTLRIPAGETSLTGTISIHADDIVEDTETVIIKVTNGSEANVSNISPVTITFNILNLTEGDLAIGLDWDATGFAFPDGSQYDPHELADLRLVISSTPDNSGDIGVADGSGAEEFLLESDLADGDYYIVADWYSAIETVEGDEFDVNLTLTFDQVGIINGQTHEFTAALNSAVTCPVAYYVLAKVTKSGDNYTFEEIGTPSPAPNPSGTYDVVTNAESTDPGPTENPLVDFMSTVTITDNGDGTFTTSDGWAGVYVEWYDIYGNTDLEPQTFTVDPCGGFTTSWTDVFGGENTLVGQVNTDGTITVRLDNVYGDFGDAVYTPQ